MKKENKLVIINPQGLDQIYSNVKAIKCKVIDDGVIVDWNNNKVSVEKGDIIYIQGYF